MYNISIRVINAHIYMCVCVRSDMNSAVQVCTTLQACMCVTVWHSFSDLQCIVLYISEDVSYILDVIYIYILSAYVVENTQAMVQKQRLYAWKDV